MILKYLIILSLKLQSDAFDKFLKALCFRKDFNQLLHRIKLPNGVRFTNIVIILIKYILLLIAISNWKKKQNE